MLLVAETQMLEQKPVWEKGLESSYRPVGCPGLEPRAGEQVCRHQSVCIRGKGGLVGWPPLSVSPKSHGGLGPPEPWPIS